jgi:regulator of extracellular matrix RemA (YlzA/DUF370 family)
MDSNHIILSSVQPDTISQRLLAMQPSFQLGELASAEKQGSQGDL